MTDSNKSEELFELGASIRSFLDADGDVLSDEEQESVSPILNSLYESRYHFSDEQFLISGGEKKISKVYDTFANRTVAMAHPLRHETRSEKEEFLREAQLASKLQHPSILPIYEIGVDDQDMPFFVMRLLEGEELKNIVRDRINGSKRYSLETLLEIFLKVCDAMIYAHSRGVLHLDLKPSNIVVGKYGQAVLYDWGLAQVVDRSFGVKLDEQADPFDVDMLNNVTCSGTLKGTPGYMAPEQIESEGQVSAATDIYALGAVLYFLLTGTIPVRGSDIKEILKNTREGRVVRPRIRRKKLNCPRSLGAVAMKALQLKPENRYGSVLELHAEVTRYLRGYAPQAERAGPFKQMQLLARRHSKVSTAIFLFGTVLIAVITLFYTREKSQSQKLELARAEAVLNLAHFQEEQKVSEKLYRDLREFMAEDGNLGSLRTHKLLARILEQELQRGDLDEEFRAKLVRMQVLLALAKQNFHEVMDVIDNNRQWWQWLELYYQVAERFAERKPDDAAQLSDADFVPFLEFRIQRRHHKVLKALAYDLHMVHSKPDDPESYLPVAIAMLNVINDTSGWGDHVRLEPCDGGYHLDLSGSPHLAYLLPSMHTWRYGGVLGPLELVSIDLSYSLVSNIWEFQKIETLETLILLDVETVTETGFFTMLKRLPMQQVILTDGAHEARFIEQLRAAGKEVILVPPGESWSRP